VDAYRLCELYYKEEFEPFKKKGVQLLNLRSLTRHYNSVSNLFVQIKLQFQAVLDQVFPEYKGVFGDLYSKVSLSTLLEFPAAESVLAVTEAHLADRICKVMCESFAALGKRKGTANHGGLIVTHSKEPSYKATCSAWRCTFG
jgi:hypothetical protein